MQVFGLPGHVIRIAGRTRWRSAMADRLTVEQAALAVGIPRSTKRPRREGAAPLSPRTVHHDRHVLIKALNQAVVLERLAKNPALASTPPKVERQKMLAYDAAQTAS